MNNRVHQGHLARKRFGQNFLNDQFVIDSIVSAINPQKGQAMVEIGPGLAALTEPVGERLDQLTVIEPVSYTHLIQLNARELIIEVADRGVGIRPDIRERIFERGVTTRCV